MASRQSEALALADRCERAGFRVVRGTRGIKVYNEAGTMFSIHKGDDMNTVKLITADLEKDGGLLDLEKRMVNARVTKTQANNRRATTAAERKAAAIAAQAPDLPAALARAAGPYLTGAEDIGVMWFAEKHPAPWMRWANMTPEIARFLLENHNTLNRPLSDTQVDYYMAIIRSGQWHLTHQGMAMDTDAVLQDGQHRLQAIDLLGEQDLTATPGAKYLDAKGNLRIPVPFFVGMATENFAAIDEGLLRTASQLFGRAHEKNGSALQTGIRLVVAYRSGTPRAVIRLRTPNEKILGTFAESPDLFRDSAGLGMSIGRKCHTSAGVITAAHYLLRKANGENNKFVTAFFEGIATGLKTGTRMILDDADPRNVFREQMELNKLAHTKRDYGRSTTRKRLTALDQLAMLIICWNNLVNNYHPRVLKYSMDSEVPRIIVCRDSGKSASSCPTALVGEVDGTDES